MVNLTDGYSDTIDKVSSFISEGNYSFPVYFDTESNAADAYNIYSIPETFFIDASGNIVASYTGSLTEANLENYIQYLIGGANDGN